MSTQTIRQIVLIWVMWSIVIVGYMHIAPMRYAPQRPDDSLVWTADWTNNQPYLLEPFLNEQVAWDSEFYLSIATVGYDDPDVQLVEEGNTAYSMSYAFFPFYPYLIKVVRLPFVGLGLSPIAASTAAGLAISLLGTLAAMLALADIIRDKSDEKRQVRTAFMLLIFPSSLFFATVYTEGLFVGLAFCSLALMRRDRLIGAAVLAAFATWTRTIGGVLIIPLAMSWFLAYRAASADDRATWLLRLPVLALPLLAYAIWRMAFGTEFDFVQANWFGNQLFQFELTVDAWRQILDRAQDNPETQIIVALNVGSVALALLSCLYMVRQYPRLAIFGALAVIIPLTAGWTGTQSSFRYVLVVPTLWVLLGTWTQNPTFERIWMLVSILLLGMQAFLFSFDFWVA